MGCDIHLFVEKQINGTWVSADRWRKQDDSQGETRPFVDYNDRFYSGRNYGLFAILADVRNGRGFAGIKTGEGYNPIAQPRGLPQDCSDAIVAESDEWGVDGHSHSWFTVNELMAYDWTQVTCLQGWVDAVSFEKFDRYQKARGDEPDEWCGMITGPDIKHIENEEMRSLLSGKGGSLFGPAREQAIAYAAPNCYTLVEWTQPYYKVARKFLAETLPRLWQLGAPDSVRIVFWFDN